ncbi:MAG: hypothetical protein IRZ07_00775 [Microbispora sp.]|nr:hypothetical protein [Microbispora sp.]
MTDQLPTKDVNDAPWPVWCEAVQDDIYYASEIDPYIQHLRDELAREVGTREARVAENEELRRDLTRTESAHAVVMAENAYYKQLAADRESALRNCLLLAMRQARKDSDWKHIIRFCREGGVEPSPLRERAAQPPPVARNPDWCPTCTKPYAECRCNGVAW